METIDLAIANRRWFGWTHHQELDRLELGEKAARCIKGENGPLAEQIVAGRAHRLLIAKMREKTDYGRKTVWTG